MPEIPKKKAQNDAIFNLQAAKVAIGNANNHLSAAIRLIEDNFKDDPEWESTVDQASSCTVDQDEIANLLRSVQKIHVPPPLNLRAKIEAFKQNQVRPALLVNKDDLENAKIQNQAE